MSNSRRARAVPWATRAKSSAVSGHLERALALARRDRRSVGLLVLKLDRHGKPDEPASWPVEGDLIRQFAKRLAAFGRASDLPARLDEGIFLVVLTAMTATK